MLWTTEAYDRARHYDTISPWWKAHGWGRVPPEILPRGAVVLCDGRPVAAGFVHCSIDAAVAVLAWPTVDPKYPFRWKALCHLLHAMKAIALDHVGAAGFVYGFTANRVVRWAYELEGLQVAEPNSATMFFPVGNLDFTFITEDDSAEPAARRRPAVRATRQRNNASAIAFTGPGRLTG